MSVQAPDVINVVTGADAIAVVPISGFFFKDADVRVYLVETTDDVATETLLTLTTDYTITKALSTGIRPEHYTGSITTVNSILISQDIVTFVVPANDQLTDFSAIPHDPADYELQDDLAAIRDQSALEFFKRSIRKPLNYIGAQPIISGGVAGKALTWDDDGNIVDGPDADDLANAEGYAEQSRDSAATSVEHAAIAVAAAAAANPNNWTRQLFSGTGASANYTLTADPGSRDNVFVDVDGVNQHSGEYTVVGTTLTMLAPVGTDNIEVRYGVSVDVGTPADETITAAKISASDVAAIRAKIGAEPAIAGRIIDLAYIPSGEDDVIFGDGSAVSRTAQAPLFAKIGVTYGNGDGATTFNLPDYRGLVSRAQDDGAGVDPDAATRTDRGDGTAGDNVGTKQGGQNSAHDHAGATGSDGAHNHTPNGGGYQFLRANGTISGDQHSNSGTGNVSYINNVSLSSISTTNTVSAHTHTISSEGGAEARMKNISVYRCLTTGL